MRYGEDEIETQIWADGEAREIHIWRSAEVQIVFVAVHGGMSHGGDWSEFARYFRGRNCATVAFDLRGHDRKRRIHVSRFDGFLDDLAMFIEWAKQKYPGTPLVLVGHSMGALILTHFGLRRMTLHDSSIVGFVLSSPYFANALKVPSLLLRFSGFLSSTFPRMKLPIKDFSHQLTHDAEIEKRLIRDATDGIRATEVTVRFGQELLVAQEFVSNNIDRWSFPVLVFIAGQDKLADSDETERLVRKISAEFTETVHYPNNYHDNFNELNRRELFRITRQWVESRLDQPLGS